MSFLSFLRFSNSSAYIPHLPSSLGPGINESTETSFSPTYVLSTFVLFLVLLSYGKGMIFAGNKRKSAIHGIPSPSTISFLRAVYEILTSKDSTRKLVALAIEYGRTYRKYYRFPGPLPIVVLNSLEAVEALISSNEDGHMVKSDEYSVMADYFDEGLVTSNGEKWRSRRKLFSPLFNYRCFPHFLEVFNRHSKHLVTEFDKLFQDNEAEAKSIQTPIYETALKIICETAMGVELNDTPKEFDTFFEEADKSKAYIFDRISRPWLQIKWIWKLHPFRSEYERNVKFIKDFMLKVIVDARRKFTREFENDFSQLVDRNKTVMDVMLENGLSDSDIREEAHTIISAGHETSAASLQFALMLLALHPEHQSKCQEEIDEIIIDESKCPNGDLTLASIAELKHTERCVKETLRLYPTIYMYGRKIRAPLRIDENTVIPEDTNCVIFAPSVHLNPEIYPEPEKFDPSRFTPENSAARHPYAYLPFSRGPRMCLGYKFAMTQMTLILARILHHFSVSTTEKIEDVPLDASILLLPVRGYNFLLKRRNALPPFGK